MSDLKVHLERNLARYEAAGDDERVKKVKARLAELAPKPEPKPKAKKPTSKKKD